MAVLPAPAQIFALPTLKTLPLGTTVTVTATVLVTAVPQVPVTVQ